MKIFYRNHAQSYTKSARYGVYSEENFEAVNAKNADVSDFSDLAGGQELEVLGA